MTQTSDFDAIYAEVARQLRDADRILFVTGAGLSADSGLPTDRGAGGLYEGNLTEKAQPSIDPSETGLSAIANHRLPHAAAAALDRLWQELSALPRAIADPPQT